MWVVSLSRWTLFSGICTPPSSLWFMIYDSRAQMFLQRVACLLSALAGSLLATCFDVWLVLFSYVESEDCWVIWRQTSHYLWSVLTDVDTPHQNGYWGDGSDATIVDLFSFALFLRSVYVSGYHGGSIVYALFLTVFVTCVSLSYSFARWPPFSFFYPHVLVRTLWLHVVVIVEYVRWFCYPSLRTSRGLLG
jgi:hypothetical protein